MTRTLCVLAAVAALCACTANVSARGPAVVVLPSVRAVGVAYGAPRSHGVYAPVPVHTVPVRVVPAYRHGYPVYRGIYRPRVGGGYVGVGPVIW